jgi:predicted AAA+ superfamily ATPase
MKDLQAWKASTRRKPLIILGARQVGKTYLTKEFGANEFKTTHSFNFEMDPQLATLFSRNLDPKRILEELSFVSARKIDPQHDLIFFDEIQAAPKALTSLKHFHEQMPELALCAAGSLLGLHLAESSFPVGSVDWLHLYPMSFGEFVDARSKGHIGQAYKDAVKDGGILDAAHQTFLDLWREYLVTGGLPEVVLRYIEHKPGSLDAFAEARKVQQKLINDYLADVAKHSGKVNAMHIERTWRSVPRQIAAAQDMSVSRFKFKDVIPGVHNYGRLAGPIDWLTKAGLVIQLPVCEHAQTPLSAYTKANHFKLLMFDVGILNAMLEMPPSALSSYDFGTYKGYIAENFVAQELKTSQPGVSFYGWSEGKSEIEFLLQGHDGPVPVEVKSASRIRAKSLKTFVDKYQPHTSIVISSRPILEMPHTNGKTINVNLPLFLAERVWKYVNKKHF